MNECALIEKISLLFMSRNFLPCAMLALSNVTADKCFRKATLSSQRWQRLFLIKVILNISLSLTFHLSRPCNPAELLRFSTQQSLQLLLVSVDARSFSKLFIHSLFWHAHSFNYWLRLCSCRWRHREKFVIWQRKRMESLLMPCEIFEQQTDLPYFTFIFGRRN